MGAIRHTEGSQPESEPDQPAPAVTSNKTLSDISSSWSENEACTPTGYMKCMTRAVGGKVLAVLFLHPRSSPCFPGPLPPHPILPLLPPDIQPPTALGRMETPQCQGQSPCTKRGLRPRRPLISSSAFLKPRPCLWREKAELPPPRLGCPAAQGKVGVLAWLEASECLEPCRAVADEREVSCQPASQQRPLYTGDFPFPPLNLENTHTHGPAEDMRVQREHCHQCCVTVTSSPDPA
ncbi:PREDICTED: uncharacterized protein LOC108538004 [Rhinopithecus bieti]|uniref:uncharacterized protein LOC108538004 n=1 Tax=Rhinopithecus bieti TaxID=61621 RepID=UPI00083BFBEF|nr:PREDICTED: uncharacterized protein LOC108538004 [Rhinopithecus bieti]